MDTARMAHSDTVASPAKRASGLTVPVHNAWRPGVQETDREATPEQQGVRDISRNLGLAKGTAISGPAKNALSMDVEIRFSDEGDEFRSHVGKKKNRRWTWYFIEGETGMCL